MTNHAHIGIRRALAWLVTLAMMLSLTGTHALAQEDWQALSITLTWVDEWGNPGLVTATPVEGSVEQAFWAQVPQEAMASGVSLLLTHPGHSYAFQPADGEPLTGLMDAGDTMDSQLAVPIYAFEGEQLADSYLLYVSTQPQPQTGTDLPPQPVQAQVMVIHRDEAGTVFAQETATISAGMPQTFYAGMFEGYELASDETVTVLVDDFGIATPAMVEFVYRRQPTRATVPVTHRDEYGNILEQNSFEVTENEPQTFSAGNYAGYELVSDAQVTVSVDSNGVGT